MTDECFVLESAGQGCDALAARQQMHGERIGIFCVPQRFELLAKPAAELSEDHACIALRRMLELGQFGAQCSDWTAVALDVLAIANHHVCEAAKPVDWCLSGLGPPIQHR